MDSIVGVIDGSCTDCDGATAADCAAATCETGYHTFVDGVGCSGTEHPLPPPTPHVMRLINLPASALTCYKRDIVLF